jgi:methionyl-tRNA formyltransferase
MPRLPPWSATLKPPPRKPRGVFFGTSDFSVPALRAFAASTDCALVVTQPDRPSGRGQRLQPTPVKVAALELGLAVAEPQTLRDGAPFLRDAAAEVFAVASYGKILPQSVLDLPVLGALNVHPSLLPLYRGATPLQAQLRDGVTDGGVTIILMDAGMDTGDIVLQERRAIGARETYGELHDACAALGARLLAEACALAAAGTLERRPQAGLASAEEIARTVTRPLGKDDLRVDWSWPARRIVDQVRSLSPVPGARATLDGEAQMVKLLEVRQAAGPSSDELVVPCGGGEFVAIERLVPPNRKPMTGRAYRSSLAARS